MDETSSRITIVLPADLAEQVRQVAQAEDRSPRDQVRALIRRGLQRTQDAPETLN